MKQIAILAAGIALLVVIAVAAVMTLDTSADERVIEVEDDRFCSGMREVIDPADPQGPGTMTYYVDADCDGRAD